MPITEAESASSRIEVAVGVIRRGDDEVLVGQRLARDGYYGKWEFPGGKLELGETLEKALSRELGEELGIRVKETSPLIRLDHDYPERKVRLHVMEVLSYSGEPHGREGQAVEWVSLAKTTAKDYLEATRPIFRALTLPHRILITDVQRFGASHIYDHVKIEVERAATALVQVRERWMNGDERAEFILRLIELTKGSSMGVVVNGDVSTNNPPGVCGIHLSAACTRSAAVTGYEKPSDILLGCSCHSEQEVKAAISLGADYLTLGSVHSTPSHPDGETLGIAGFSELSSMASVPTYAVGGMTDSHIDAIRQAGGQGVAMISAAWT